MERKCLLRPLRTHGHDNGVAGIVATRTAGADVMFGGEDVDEFAFAFIAPLRAEYNRSCFVYKRRAPIKKIWTLARAYKREKARLAAHCVWEMLDLIKHSRGCLVKYYLIVGGATSWMRALCGCNLESKRSRRTRERPPAGGGEMSGGRSRVIFLPRLTLAPTCRVSSPKSLRPIRSDTSVPDQR